MVRRGLWGGALLLMTIAAFPLGASADASASAGLPVGLPRAGGVPSDLLLLALPLGVAAIGLGLVLRRVGSR